VFTRTVTALERLRQLCPANPIHGIRRSDRVQMVTFGMV
jgi:hypothetical protein